AVLLAHGANRGLAIFRVLGQSSPGLRRVGALKRVVRHCSPSDQRMRPEMEGSADSRAGQTPHVRRVVCTDVLSVMAAVGAHGYTRFRSCAPQISDGNNVVAD